MTLIFSRCILFNSPSSYGEHHLIPFWPVSSAPRSWSYDNLDIKLISAQSPVICANRSRSCLWWILHSVSRQLMLWIIHSSRGKRCVCVVDVVGNVSNGVVLAPWSRWWVITCTAHVWFPITPAWVTSILSRKLHRDSKWSPSPTIPGVLVPVATTVLSPTHLYQFLPHPHLSPWLPYPSPSLSPCINCE